MAYNPMDDLGKTKEEVINTLMKRGISDYTAYSLYNYNYHKIPTGDFLRAVLSNDLFGAMNRADDTNSRTIKEICMVIYNDMPNSCYGSAEIVDKWLSTRKVE